MLGRLSWSSMLAPSHAMETRKKVEKYLLKSRKRRKGNLHEHIFFMNLTSIINQSVPAVLCSLENVL